MDPSQAISQENQLQAIDDEIKSLEKSIRTLRYRCNTLVPTSSLPTEVITAIFSFFQAVSLYNGEARPSSMASCNPCLSSMARNCTQSTPSLE